MAWNHPNQSKKNLVPKRRSAERCYGSIALIATAVVLFVVCGGLMAKYLTYRHDEDHPVCEHEKPMRKALAPLKINPKPVAAKEPEKPLRFWEVDAAHTNGFTEMQMRKWRKEHMPPSGYTNTAVLTRPKPAYAIFNHSCDNLIAAYLTLKPGEGMIGSPMLGDRFRQQFLKSLDEPIVITADDSPENAQLKRDMIDTKLELKARMDAGEDICKIIADTHKEVQDLARYKSMLQKEIREATKDPDMTMEDVDNLVDAANKMLDAKGIAPITLGPISRRLIQRRKGF